MYKLLNRHSPDQVAGFKTEGIWNLAVPQNYFAKVAEPTKRTICTPVRIGWQSIATVQMRYKISYAIAATSAQLFAKRNHDADQVSCRETRIDAFLANAQRFYQQRPSTQNDGRKYD